MTCLKFGEFGQAIERFFYNGERVRRGLAKRFLEKLEPIRQMMEQKGRFRYYASSILFIYEGHEGSAGHSGGEDADDLSPEEVALQASQSDHLAKIDVRMIDFAHVFPMGPEERDDSYLCGLTNFMSVLKGIAEGANATTFEVRCTVVR